MKTSELIGPVLDWAVAKCEESLGLDSEEQFLRDHRIGFTTRYSANWSQGGPIIEREIYKLFRNVGGAFTAQIKIRVPYYSPTYDADIGRDEVISCAGPTPLIAAMRCYCASKLGDEIEIPSELQP